MQFTKSLACELKGLGIDVQVQTLLWVTTKLAKIRKTSLTVPSPSTYAKQAVRFVGYDVACSPYWAHALQLSVADLLPSSLLAAAVFSMHRAIRKQLASRRRPPRPRGARNRFTRPPPRRRPSPRSRRRALFPSIANLKCRPRPACRPRSCAPETSSPALS